jgi:hypothetical protein
MGHGYKQVIVGINQSRSLLARDNTIEIEIVYNMYRVKPVVVYAPPPVCAVSGLLLT